MAKLKVTFVHTSTLLNLRGSEIWLMDVSKLLKSVSISVRIINFDYAPRYPRTKLEKTRRIQLVKDSFQNIPVFNFSGFRLRVPSRRLRAVKFLNEFVDEHLHFVPLNRQFYRLLDDSDLIYFLQSQKRPSYLIPVLFACTISGARPVVAGFHVDPEITPFDAALLRIFVGIGILKGVHLINKNKESEIRKKLGCAVRYIPDGIFFEDFYSEIAKTSEKFLIIFVGGMTEAKGADRLPEIYYSLKRMNIDFSLLICTSGGELTDRIRDWSQGKSDVAFKGFVARGELAKLYSEASVALFPSKREAFSIACLEAQASGTPVVVSDADGFKQTVVDGETGLFAKYSDPNSFADKILAIHNLWKSDRSKYLAMCSDAQSNVKQNFQWKDILKALVDFFEQVSCRN